MARDAKTLAPSGIVTEIAREIATIAIRKSAVRNPNCGKCDASICIDLIVMAIVGSGDILGHKSN
jgi:hypothetical protein